MKNSTNPFWNTDNKKNFGAVAIEYAAGKDIILDKEFVLSECLVNEVHQLMLLKTRILSKKQVISIVKVLEEIKKDYTKGQFILKKELEDVHSNVEKFVIDTLGIEVGGNLRLGIARNDQIYADSRIFLRNKILSILDLLVNLNKTLLTLSAKNVDTIMPGFTHSRVSQPMTFAHWTLAKCYHFLDDINNLEYDYQQVNLSPLGIFEFAGTHLPIDRRMTAKLLGFDGILTNSLYTADSRGELEAKILADFSLLAFHIKRTVNELILWSTREYNLVQIDDLYTTGGTAQPNLKNPDTLEVLRANCAKIYGKFLETVVIMDSLPSGYNRDTQQTKSTIIESVEIIESALPVFTGILDSLKLNKDKMLASAEINFSTAPDLTNQIAVKANVSFREAYLVMKSIIKKGYIKKSLKELTSEILSKAAKEVLQKDIYVEQNDIDELADVKKRTLSIKSEGGPSPRECLNMIKDLDQKISHIQEDIVSKKAKIEKSLSMLTSEIKTLLS